MSKFQTIAEKLPVPSEFPFPFKPYFIQLEFMQNLYSVIEENKLGIFESPTGTGKSLSIICGAIKWLKDHNASEKQFLADSIIHLESQKEALNAETSDWFSAQGKALEVSQKLNAFRIIENKIFEYDKKITDIIDKGTKKCKKVLKYKSTLKTEEVKDTEEKSQIEDNDILLEENEELDNGEDEDKLSDDEEEKYKPTKILIASRTHSQLSQFIGEIKKSPFGNQIRVVSLASRQNYCINSNVRKLKNMSLINERCLEIQKRSSVKSKLADDGKDTKRRKTSSCQCPYFKQSNIEDLRDWALSGVHDIEDLVQAGKELNACPYYASRKAAEDSEIVLVPYNTLLHKSTREASGIDLRDNVVIIDEAHNLLEAIAQMHSADLSFSQLYYSLNWLKCYKQRYCTLFSAANLLKINQLIFVVNKLYQMLDKDVKENITQIHTLENFVLTAEIENYNFFKLIKFCKESKIAQKIRSYSIKYPLENELVKKPTKAGIKDFLASIENQNKKLGPETTQEKSAEKSIPVPSNPLLSVVAFLESLTYSCDDGRVLHTISNDKQNSKVQFLLLNASSNFSEIIKQARSVIVAGGTMKPNEEFRDRLFINGGASSDRITEFSCDHIIPPENILPIIVTKGANEENVLFNFNNRLSMGPLLRNVLKQACQLIPGGIVVFFPSYKYENWVWDQVKTENLGRPIFREPQTSGTVDVVLEKYSSTIKKSKTGALMFSVVGGKLSEGLNFSDDLGRCIIVVGLPYANITAVDLKEKMQYLDSKEGQGAGQKFYENLCMKSVNQCIGRAVRHRNDYATVLLLDERYNRTNIKNALPDWIKRSLKVCKFRETFGLIGQFFEEKKSKK